MEEINRPFKLVSSYKPTGDQPEAIAKLVEGIKKGDKEQTLLGSLVLARHLPWQMLLLR